MNTIVDFGTFEDLTDAHDWMFDKMREFRGLGPEWSVREARIAHLNGGWSAGVLFQKVKVDDFD
jgi:hypothetical protein